MATVAPIQSHFSGGEISPLLSGRVDADRYKTSMALCKNFIPTLQGGLPRRPGSVYVGTASTTPVGYPNRLIPFQFSTTQSYILEFGNGIIRFWTEYGQVITAPNTPYQINSYYNSLVIKDMKFTQSADVLYMTHPSQPPAKLERFGATDWRISYIQFTDGPYGPILNENYPPFASAVLSATSGTASLSVGSFSGISGTASGTGGVVRLTLPAWSPTNNLEDGALYWISGVVGTVEANGIWPIRVVDSTHIELIGTVYANAFSATGSPEVNPAPFIDKSFPTVKVAGASNSGNNYVQVPDSSIFATQYNGVRAWFYITGVAGTTGANGYWQVDIVDATHIHLLGAPFFGSAYTAGTGTISRATFPGQLVRLEAHTGTPKWGWGTITGGTNPYTATVDLIGTHASVTIDAVRLGAYSWNTGFPSTVTFHQDRLIFDGPPNDPQRIDGSTVSDYQNFSPTDPDGTVTDANAYSFNLTANDVNSMEWFSSDDKGLLAGSVSAEWVLRPSRNLEAITATNVSAERTTRWGSNYVPAVSVGRATIFCQRGGRKIREMHYFFDIDSYRATDLTELAEHITGSGITALAHQALPISLLWVLRNDGVLLAMTYDRDAQQLRAGWSQHVLGGVGDAAGNPPVVESIAVIPSPDGTIDDVWMVVKRYVNGATVHYVEYLAKIFESIDLQKDAHHLDCGATYDNPITISTFSVAATPTVHKVAHGLSTGDVVQFDTVLGLYLSGASVVNGKWSAITVTDANNFTLDSLSTAGASAFISGVYRKRVSTISGLTYLENETISIYADGAVQADVVVSNAGVVTLPSPACVVSLGYSYNSDGKLLRLEAGARNGTSLGKNRRTHRVGVLLNRSQSLQMGKDFDHLDPIQFRTQGVDPDGYATPLFTGIESHTVEFDYDFDNQICFRVSNPMPCTILAIMPMLETQDRA